MKILINVNCSVENGKIKIIAQGNPTDGSSTQFFLNASCVDTQTNTDLLTDIKNQFVTQIVAEGTQVTVDDILLVNAPI